MHAEVVELVLSWIVTTALSFAVVLFDERRSSEERLERAWIPASRDAALVAFGILAVPIHFIKTRGDFKSARGLLGKAFGLVLGITAFVGVAVVSSLLMEGLARIFGWPTE
jgi:hypothetical protein